MSEDGLVNDLTYGVFKAMAITIVIPVTMKTAVTRFIGTFIMLAIAIRGGMMTELFGGMSRP